MSFDDSRHQRTRQFGHDLDPRLPPPAHRRPGRWGDSCPDPDFAYDDRLRGLPPQCCYLDAPTSEVTNDVCIRWDALLVWVSTYVAGRGAPWRPAGTGGHLGASPRGR